VELFHENSLLIFDRHIPAKLVSASNYLPWMTFQLKKLIKRKQRLYNQAKRLTDSKIGNHINTQAVPSTIYLKVATSCNWISQLMKVLSYLKLDNDNNRRKLFWQFIKSHKQDTSFLQTPTDQVTAIKEIEEILNNQLKQYLKLQYPHFYPLMTFSFVQVVY